MDDADFASNVAFSGTAALAAAVGSSDFSKAVLDFVGKAARFRNFGAFFFPNLRNSAPVLSVWSGSISDYWFRRNAQIILEDADHVNALRSLIRRAPDNGARIHFFLPRPGQRRFDMYARAKLHGRVSISSRTDRAGLHSFFLRSQADGAFSEAEKSRLQEVLPIAHTMIALRHRIVGSEAIQFVSGSNASSLRNRGVSSFVQLSPKEAETCDLIAQGQSAAESALALGVSVNSVRTLRQRAYRKLGVHSSREVAALVLKNSQQADDA